MRLRFSCVAFVPPDAQLGVTGSPSFLGGWNPNKCIPLLPYTKPAEGGVEPSLWFADIDLDENCIDANNSAATDGCNNNRSKTASSKNDSFTEKLLAAMACTNKSVNARASNCIKNSTRSMSTDETSNMAAASKYRIDHRSPEITAVLELYPLKHIQFEYKFIMWTPKKPPTPYVPDMPGEAFACSSYGSPSCTWRTWLFPPPPAQRTEFPTDGMNVLWEGTGPSRNRKFVFDPMDIVVDECETGKPEVLYLCKIARFEDPRANDSSEYDHTTRFYNLVKSEGRMNYSRILPNLYVGSCPRQLKHIQHLKQDLKVTAIFNLQTAEDIKNNFPDPLASTRTPEAVSQIYQSADLRYVWMPTEDMSDVGRKLVVAQCALILDGLVQNGHSVYVHCNAGVGRSVAAVCAYLCFSIGLDLRKVNFLVNAKRPVAYWDENAIKSGLVDYQLKFGEGVRIVHDA